MILIIITVSSVCVLEVTKFCQPTWPGLILFSVFLRSVKSGGGGYSPPSPPCSAALVCVCVYVCVCVCMYVCVCMCVCMCVYAIEIGTFTEVEEAVGFWSGIGQAK